MDLASIKNKATEAANKAKDKATSLAEKAGNKLMDKAMDKIAGAKDKVESLGVKLFNPMENLTSIKNSILDEQNNLLDTRKLLDGVRDNFEKAAQLADLGELKEYVSSLQDRAQDAFVTAIADSAITELIPDSITNPFSGDGEGGGFLDAAGDLFGAAKDLASSALEKITGEEGGLMAAVDKMTSGEGGLMSALKEVVSEGGINIPGISGETSNTLANIISDKSSSFADVVNKAIDKVTGDDASGLLGKVGDTISKVTGIDTSGALNIITNAIADVKGDATSFVKDIANKDISGVINDTVTQKTISSISESISKVLSSDAATGIVNNIADAFIKSSSEIAGVLSDTSSAMVGAATTESVAKAINETATAEAASKGDTEAVAKAVVEEKIIWCSGGKCCGKCAKTCNQTQKAVTDVLATAEVLGIDLDTVQNNPIKTPDDVNNIAINEPGPPTEEPEDPLIDTLDLVEFKALIANGTTLAKILLGADVFNKCMALLKAEETIQNNIYLEPSTAIA